jgi:DNA-binding MarR family transcriptional regulator
MIQTPDTTSRAYTHTPIATAPVTATRQRPHVHSNPALDAIITVSMAAEFLRSQVDKAVAPLEITGVQYNILRVLNRCSPEGLSRTEILRHLVEKSVDVTRSIDGLIRLGLVRRERPEQDRRLSITSITDTGIEALHKTDPLFYSMMTTMGERMNAEEFRELSRLCHKLIASGDDESK